MALVATLLTLGVSPRAVGSFAQAATDSDARGQALLARAREAEQKHDFQIAAAAYREYLKTQPDDAEILQRLGLVEYLSNQFEQAIPPLSKALRLNPSLWGSDLYLGISYYRTDRFKEAIPVLSRALALKPGVAETEYWLGCSFLADDQLDPAISHLLATATDANWGLQARQMLVNAYRKAAEASYQRIAAVAPDSERVHLAKAELLEWKGINKRGVWESREALERNPNLEGAHRLIGEVYWQEKEFGQSASEFESELAINPLDGESNLRLGEFWLAKGDAQRAVPYLKAALEQRAGSPGEADHFLGEADLARHDYAQAIADLKRAVAANPGDPANHRLLAEAYRGSNQPDLAATEEQLSHVPGTSSAGDNPPEQ